MDSAPIYRDGLVGEHSLPCEGAPRGTLEEREESMLA